MQSLFVLIVRLIIYLKYSLLDTVAMDTVSFAQCQCLCCHLFAILALPDYPSYAGYAFIADVGCPGEILSKPQKISLPLVTRACGDILAPVNSSIHEKSSLLHS
jgi:hypothetical protein